MSSNYTFGELTSSAIRNPLLFSAASWIFNMNDPKATAVTAFTEVTLLPVMEEIYSRIIGEKTPTIEKMGRFSKDWESLKKFIVYETCSVTLTYMSAKASEMITGKKTDIFKYIIIAQSSTALYVLAKQGARYVLIEKPVNS